jgi:hypothetical protein
MCLFERYCAQAGFAAHRPLAAGLPACAWRAISYNGGSQCPRNRIHTGGAP